MPNKFKQEASSSIRDLFKNHTDNCKKTKNCKNGKGNCDDDKLNGKTTYKNRRDKDIKDKVESLHTRYVVLRKKYPSIFIREVYSKEDVNQEFIRNTLMLRLGLKMNTLERIFNHLNKMCLLMHNCSADNDINETKYKQINGFCLSNIVINPYDFITEEQCLLSFSTAERIRELLQLDIPLKQRVSCWIYDYLLNRESSLYITRGKLHRLLYEYCAESDDKKETVDSLIKELCIEVEIDKKTYLTIPYYYELEKSMTRDMLELYGSDYGSDYSSDDEDSFDTDDKDDIEQFIDEYESEHASEKLKVNDKQREAVHKCITNKFQVVCGFPGTGKSTIIDIVTSYFNKTRSSHDYTYNISLSAPTGLAINNLKSKCSHYNKEASGTLHRLLYNIFYYMSKKDMLSGVDINSIIEKSRTINSTNSKNKLVEELTKNEQLYIKIDKLVKSIPHMLIIDECSMIHILLMKDILKYCKEFKCRLILLGDENQLPPVGPGETLRQMLDNDEFKNNNVIYLTDIMRQSCPHLKKNIHKIIDPDDVLMQSDFESDTMVFKKYDSILKQSKDKVIDIQELKKFIHMNGLQQKGNTQFLTPQETLECGHEKLNIILQDIYNPKNNTNYIYCSCRFRVGDLVVRIVNDYSTSTSSKRDTDNMDTDKDNDNDKDKDENKDNDEADMTNAEVLSDVLYANGDTGYIVGVDNMGNITIEYDCHEKPHKTQIISVSDLNEQFKLRYCLSIHKSQGNQYDNVVLFVGTPHNWIWTSRETNPKKLLYTAISRTKDRCYVIGNDMCLIQSQLQEDIKRPSLFLE